MSQKVIITHDGNFHLDEILAYSILKKIHPKSHLLRTRDTKIIDHIIETNQYIAIIDVYGKFDPEKNFFDHHQQGFNEKFYTNGNIKLSSAGLVYKYFSKQLFEAFKIPDPSADLINEVYEDYFKYVDANDNGVSVKSDMKIRSLADIVQDCPNFEKAFILVREDMNNYFCKIRRDVRNREVLEMMVKKCEGDILFTRDMGNVTVLVCEIEKKYGKDIMFLVDEKENGFSVYAARVDKNSFENKVSLKESWRGLRNNELEKVSGIQGAVFVHSTGFMGICRTMKGAVKMCELSLNE